MAKPKYNWHEVDWNQSNRDIANVLGCPYDTVAHKRLKLGVGKATVNAQRIDKGQKNPKRSYGAVNQPLATDAAKQSPKSGKFETNIHAKEWRLISPDGKAFEIRNLYQFVRDNSHLFSLLDTVWKRTGGKRGTGGEYCNATAGLLNVTSGKTKSWKGWHISKKPD